MTARSKASLGFLKGGGTMGALLRAHDWAASPLGHPSAWDQSLKTVISLMLHSKVPTFVVFGPTLCLLYNDAYLGILGPKHPASLGSPFAVVWSEVWADIEPLVNTTLSGEPVYIENAPFTIQRRGAEQTWFSFAYMPIHGVNDKIIGLYCSIVETTARVSTEKRRQQETLQLYSLFEQAPSFMAVVREPNHVYELANHAYLRLLKVRHIIGKPVRELLPQSNEQGYIALLDQVYTTGQPFIGNRMPILYPRQADSPPEQRFVDFIFQPITGPDGAVNGVFIVGNDVTEHVRTEDELRESRRSTLEVARRLDALLEAAPVGIAMADINGKLIRVNSANRRIWGGHPLTENVEEYRQWKGWWADGSEKHGRQLEPQEWAMARALRGEDAPRDIIEIETFGEPVCRRTILNCGAPVRDLDGHIMGAVVALMDITDRVLNEAALRESETKFRTITNAIPQIVWATLPDGYHDYYNQQWYDYTGVPQGSTDGDAWTSLLHPDDQEQALNSWKPCLRTGQAYENEYRLRHHSGQYRWILARALPVRDEKGAIVRWMGTCTDLHEQKLAQQALLQSDHRKDEFLAMLAHELRNPLAPIATAADLLSMGQLGEDRVRQLSEVISRQAGHMTRLIDDLLDVSRVTQGLVVLDKKPVDMKSIVPEAVEQVRPLLEAKAHHLETQMSSERAMVAGDKLRLVQVLANVLSNAIKYTPNGGRIALRMTVHESQVMLAVRDNGMGMSIDLVERAFELFTQGERTSDRSQGGLGIGLALVKSLVELHGGTVQAQSEGVGLGSDFTIALPRLLPQDEPNRLGGAESASPPALESIRVMVVDDNADAAQLLGMFLEMFGHQVFVEYGSLKAIERARIVMPHICLLDIGLPEMDGYELARQLRLIPGMEGAVLATVTGYGQPKDRQAAFEAGFNYHFVKPVDARELGSWLAERVAEVLGKGRLASASA